MERTPVESPYLVPFDGFFRVKEAPTSPPSGAPGRKGCRAALKARKRLLAELQHRLYAHDRYSVLLVFQALDAAGKDSTIRRVLSGVNPAGCHVVSFKQPSSEELDHDFLWRSAKRLPERGRIGVFNRSYYEEVLVARVQQGVLDSQRLPSSVDRERIWEHRYESIRDHELHLARNGTVILKFWLHVSKDEQARRLLRRIDDPHRNWKFSSADVEGRAHRDDYLQAYEEALNATSRPWAPWYAVPADDKDFLRMSVADIVVRAIERLNLHYPELAQSERGRLEDMRLQLEADLEG
ncbi:MAG: polyphosphate kinase 2 family protein [Alphaproteobacteria bacterium]|nr:polyphosphate kinase 2 family protein [Alphaproteobacteria bacterium]MCB9797518.1 polyphosphate kinase 2 family protein [Alphaproteobacteria bacterium]